MWDKIQFNDKRILTVPSEVLVNVFLKLLLQKNYINNATYLNAIFKDKEKQPSLPQIVMAINI